MEHDLAWCRAFGVWLTAALALGAVHSRAQAATITDIVQLMSLDVELIDQFGILEVQDGFIASFDTPSPVTLSESVGVELFGAINEASGMLQTSFAGNTLSGHASLGLTFGNFPSNVIGSSLNRIEVSFLLTVPKPTPFDFNFAVGLAAGGTSFFLGDLWLWGSDGSVFAQLGASGFGDEASGSGVFMPGVTYEFAAVLDSGIFDYIRDNPLLSFSTAFDYQIVIIPAPGLPALGCCVFMLSGRRRPKH